MRQPTNLLLSAAAALANVAAIGIQRSPLLLLVNIAEYFSEDYADRPVTGTNYVLFVGEPIRLDIQVFNPDGREHTIVSPSLTAANALSIAAAREFEPTTVRLTTHTSPDRVESVHCRSSCAVR